MSSLLDPAAVTELAERNTPLLIEITQALVRADSQTPPSDTRGTAEIAAHYLENLPGVELAFHPSDPPVMNLVARLQGGLPGPRLVLSGHLDTYPIGQASAWTEDPLGGTVRDGRLYGRGSCDMKGGIASLILALKTFAELDEPFPGEIVLALAGDEESMGELGTQRLIDTVPEVMGDAAIVADVGSPSVVRCGEKGMLWFTLTAKGRAAHGAHVHRGENALDRLLACLADVRELAALDVAMPEEVAAAMSAARDVSEPLGGAGEHEVMNSVTVNLGRLDGGTSANLVPDHAVAHLDVRLPLGISVATLEAALQKRVARHSGIDLQVTRRYEATWTEPGHPIVRATLDAAAAVLKTPVRANMRVGASDARLLRRAGIPTVVCGLTPYNLGAPDENLDTAELPRIAAIHLNAIARFLLARDDKATR